MGFKIGIALGGGAARGLAHIGVLKVLEEADIPVSVVSGTSIGAMLGAIYARRGRVEDVRQRVMSFVKSDAFKQASVHLLAQKDPKSDNSSSNGEDEGIFASISTLLKKGLLYSHGVTRQSLISIEEYTAITRELIEDVDIESFKIPFTAVAADLVTGKEIAIDKGSARMAVMASGAIPGVLPPVESGDNCLVDGGWINMVPVEPCRKLGANFVIAVDISADLEERMDFRRSINVVLRSNNIARVKLREQQLKEADFVIRPPVGDLHWADFSNMDDVIEVGAKAAADSLKSLVKKIRTARRKKWLGI